MKPGARGLSLSGYCSFTFSIFLNIKHCPLVVVTRGHNVPHSKCVMLWVGNKVDLKLQR